MEIVFRISVFQWLRWMERTQVAGKVKSIGKNCPGGGSRPTSILVTVLVFFFGPQQIQPYAKYVLFVSPFFLYVGRTCILFSVFSAKLISQFKTVLSLNERAP